MLPTAHGDPYDGHPASLCRLHPCLSGFPRLLYLPAGQAVFYVTTLSTRLPSPGYQEPGLSFCVLCGPRKIRCSAGPQAPHLSNGTETESSYMKLAREAPNPGWGIRAPRPGRPSRLRPPGGSSTSRVRRLGPSDAATKWAGPSVPQQTMAEA